MCWIPALWTSCRSPRPSCSLKTRIATRPGSRCCCSTPTDRKSTRLNSSHSQISYAVFCLKKKDPVSESKVEGVTTHAGFRDPTAYDSASAQIRAGKDDSATALVIVDD